MIVSLSIVKYRRLFIPIAFLAMAIHRIPLLLNKNCTFWKLMGCGRDGTFDLKPDMQHWALLAVWENQQDFEEFNNHSFISKWWNLFTKEQLTILSNPLVSHGKWDGKEVFKTNKNQVENTGPVAVLTRATIRFSKLKEFWSNVEPVAEIMKNAPGFITSFGIGEAPVFKQATFSIWKDMESMKSFAYHSKEHAEVIKKTRQRNWYSEELFARFQLISVSGSINGVDPIKEIRNKLIETDLS